MPKNKYTDANLIYYEIKTIPETNIQFASTETNI